MPAKITPEQHIDRFISTAPRDALVRLQSEVNAALKYRLFLNEPPVVPAPLKAKKAANNQGALALGEEQAK
jgi:hypothetical protein